MNKKPYNYTIIHNNNTTIAYSTFAGKTVKGYAKRDPEDSFDEVIGDRLATARCGLKIAKKREKYAVKKYEEAKIEMIKAIGYFNKMESYATDAIEARLDAEDELAEVLEDIEEIDYNRDNEEEEE